MVALHFYHAVFGRATRYAGGFELLTQSGQRHSLPKAKPRTTVTHLPPRTLGCALHPQHPVRHRTTTVRYGRSQGPPVSRALALRHRLAAIGADAASFGE
jgi:hypothetical protein